MLSICILTLGQGDIGPIWGTKESPSFNQLNTYEAGQGTFISCHICTTQNIFLSDIPAICFGFIFTIMQCVIYKSSWILH